MRDFKVKKNFHMDVIELGVSLTWLGFGSPGELLELQRE
jgi:hypothetical protein